MWKSPKQSVDKMTPRWCFFQLSRDLHSDFVPLLSERVTFNRLTPPANHGFVAYTEILYVGWFPRSALDRNKQQEQETLLSWNPWDYCHRHQQNMIYRLCITKAGRSRRLWWKSAVREKVCLSAAETSAESSTKQAPTPQESQPHAFSLRLDSNSKIQIQKYIIVR